VVLIAGTLQKYRQTIPASLWPATLRGTLDTKTAAHEDRAVFNPCETFMHTPAPRRQDTKAWKLQVWVSFGLAVTLCGTGLAYLPGEDLNRAFMVMGYVFCLSTAFALAKFVRDNEVRRTDTPMWGLVVWGGFALAMALTGWGLWRMDVNPTYKAYLGVCWLFLISSVFTLAKTLRDAHEAQGE
jgi:hypothetical protein